MCSWFDDNMEKSISFSQQGEMGRSTEVLGGAGEAMYVSPSGRKWSINVKGKKLFKDLVVS